MRKDKELDADSDWLIRAEKIDGDGLENEYETRKAIFHEKIFSVVI